MSHSPFSRPLPLPFPLLLPTLALLLLCIGSSCRSACPGDDQRASQPLSEGGSGDAAGGSTEAGSASDSVQPVATAPWVRTFGGDGDDEGLAAAVTPEGGVVVVGRFNGAVDFADRRTSRGGADAFAVALAPGDGAVQWARTYGGAGADSAADVAVDGAGNVYVVGQLEGVVDFEPDEPGLARHVSLGGRDAYLLCLDARGRLQWSRSWGGAGWDEAHSVDIAPDGSLVVAGRFSGSLDFDPGPETVARRSAGDVDAFVSRFDSDGELLWNRTVGGVGTDVAQAVVATADAVAVAGWFAGDVDFDPGERSRDVAARGFTDVFVLRFDVAGDFQWAWTAGGSLVDQAHALAPGADGALWVAGIFVDTLETAGGRAGENLSAAGRSDLFVARLSNSGEPQLLRGFGGPASDYGYGLSATADDGVVVGGRFGGTIDVDADRLGDEIESAGRSDALLLGLAASGAVQWTRPLGGPGRDRAAAVLSRSDGGLYVTGAFEEELDFLGAGVPAGNQRSAGATDAFILSLRP